MLDFATLVSIVLLSATAALLLAASMYPTSVLRWLQRKRYQYEVTFSLYMLTPTEKFVFNSFLFLFLSMIIIAASLYLPEHVSTIASRVFYYWAGDDAYYNPVAAAQKLHGARDIISSSTTEALRGQGHGLTEL